MNIYSYSNFKNLSDFYQNLKAFRTKLHVLRYNIPILNYDYFVLTETWLSDNIRNAELGFDNCTIYCLDKNIKMSTRIRGRSIVIYIKHLYMYMVYSV